MAAPVTPLPPEVLDALRRGQVIEAIKLLRASTGSGLKQAKDAIDASRHSVRGDTSNLSPGEVPKLGGAFRWLVAAAAAIWLAYILLRSPG